jgi:ABC-2 type transport system permease protein
MISWYCVKALIERHLLLQFRDFYRIVDNFYWPVMDLMLFGFVTIWMAGGSQGDQSMIVMVLGGLFLWNVLYRSALEISVNMLEELWSRNLMNLFTVPLTQNDWLCALLALGFIRVGIVVCLYIFSLWWIFSINLLAFGWPLLIFIALQILSGWWLGMLCMAALFYWGQRAQSLAWVSGWLLAPFSGALYPIDVLPLWMQKVSVIFPMTYTFKAFRLFASSGVLEHSWVMLSLFLNGILCALALLAFHRSFENTKRYGLETIQE